MQPLWPLWRRLLFRFFFVYLGITMAPWTWLDSFPWVAKFTRYYYTAMDWAVTQSNALFFHVRPQLVPLNGSGDTSYGWAELWFVISIAVLATIIWSFVQRNKREYVRLNYWLCLFTRYYVALVLFLYGIIKLFALQMAFPTYSQLATPLGDFLPMRFSWMFIGYSTPYQFFSGLIETFAGALLLYRRTATLGILIAAGVFLNVALLNLSYDIPVKIFSIQMVVCCLFLLVNESDRILCFFVLNRPADACQLYHFDFAKRWMRVGRIVLKALFVVIAVGMVIKDSIERVNLRKAEMLNMAFAPGLYDVNRAEAGADSSSVGQYSAANWKDVVFDNNHSGSLSPVDTLFVQRYNRSYFQYQVDTINHHLDIFRARGDEKPVASFRYQLLNQNEILLSGKRGTDSISFVLMKSPHHFQLAEKQFHWLSESNR